MPNVIIKIQARLDADVDSLFRPLEKRAEQAAAKIRDTLAGGVRAGSAVGGFGRSGGGGGGGGSGKSPEERAAERAARTAEKAAERQAKAAERASAKAAKEAERQASREEKAAERAAQRKAQVEQNAMNRMRDDIARGIRDRVAQEKRAESEITRNAQSEARRRESRIRGGVEYAARGFVNRGVHLAQRALGTGAGMMRELAQGAGVQTDVGNFVSQHVQADTAARLLSNAAYQPNQAGSPNATRVAPGEIGAQAQAVSGETGYSKLEVIQATAALVELTGDLNGAQKMMRDIAVQARGTGTDLTVAAKAAGEAQNALKQYGRAAGEKEQTPDELAQAALQQMRVQAGMGQLGAVEQKDLARYGARIYAQASQFGGDRGDVMAQLNAVAQMAKLRGGASSAAQAATAVQNFATTFNTPARIKALNAAGVQTRDENGKLFSPEELIVRAVKATKGDEPALSKLFGNVNAFRAVRGYAATYRDAGRGDAGEAAMRGQFKAMMDAAQGVGQVMDSFKTTMGGPEMAVAQFNNKMTEVAGNVADHLLPILQENEPQIEAAITSLAAAVIKAAPQISAFVGTVADLTKWAAANPFEAFVSTLGLALGGAITKAVTTEFLTTIAMRAVGLGGKGPGATEGGGVGGRLLGSGPLAAVVGTVLGAGYVYSKAAGAQKQENAGTDAVVGELIGGEKAQEEGFGAGLSDEDAAKRQAELVAKAADVRKQREHADWQVSDLNAALSSQDDDARKEQNEDDSQAIGRKRVAPLSVAAEYRYRAAAMGIGYAHGTETAGQVQEFVGQMLSQQSKMQELGTDRGDQAYRELQQAIDRLTNVFLDKPLAVRNVNNVSVDPGARRTPPGASPNLSQQ